jgi:hypothetical protein
LDNKNPYTYTSTGSGRRFGARYGACPAECGNSEISIWLSVDPLSDKYPRLSAYAYCANNPVILVDTDGRKIKIVWRDEGGKRHKAKITNRQEYDAWNKSINNESGEFALNLKIAFELIETYDDKDCLNRAIFNNKTLKIKSTNKENETASRIGNSMKWNYKNAYESSNKEKQAPIIAIYSDLIEWSVENKNAFSGKNIHYKHQINSEIDSYNSMNEHEYFDYNYMSVEFYEPDFINNLNNDQNLINNDNKSQRRTSDYYNETNDKTYLSKSIYSTETK